MPSSVFSARDKRAHLRFWKAAGRYQALRKAALQVCDDTGAQVADIHFAMTMLIGEKETPTPRHIRNFLREEKRFVFKNNAFQLTALCHAMRNLYYEDRAADIENSDKGKHVSDLDDLFTSTNVNFPVFLSKLLTDDSITAGNRPRYSREHLKQALHWIVIPRSDDDPERPEYPPKSPRFPATPMMPLDVCGRNLLIKDESRNHTGTHKDRWAWEQLILYKKKILQGLSHAKSPVSGNISIPVLSMISSGSAAYALQTLLKEYDLPPLRVIVDQVRADPGVIARLRVMGAEVFPYDLDAEELDEDLVLEITNNPGGIDITTRNVVTPERHQFYDWLTYEILQVEPSHIFVPFGTGDLFTGIALLLEKECKSKVRDRRLLSLPSMDSLRGINVYGATTHEPNTRMDKLFAAFRPTQKDVENKVKNLKNEGILGRKSGIYTIPDKRAEEARQIAKREGIQSELSGMAGLGLFIDKCDEFEIRTDEKVVVVNTGWMYDPHKTS